MNASMPSKPPSYDTPTPINVARGDRHREENTRFSIRNVLALEPNLPEAGPTRQLERACKHFYKNARVRKFLLFTLSIDYCGAAVRDFIHLSASEHEHFMRLGASF